MLFKSITQDMKGEIGYGTRSRSHLVVEDYLVTVADAEKLSSWANLPPELLRDVLMRIEESEFKWRSRKNVVSCAGVCRNWREIMKEIVETLEASGKLTFPVSLKQPGPRNSLMQCFIKRNRDMQTYHLYLNLSQASNDEGKFLLAARRCRRPAYTDYIISLKADDVSKGSSYYIGKLRSNFLGNKFTIYDAQSPSHRAEVGKSLSVGTRQVSHSVVPAGNYPVAHISYELNVLGSRGPRRMLCVMNTIPASSIEPDGVAAAQNKLLPSNLYGFPSSTSEDEMLVLRNKDPRWHEQLQCWCLNFNGRITVASVKNFQLIVCVQEQEMVVLQFGKVGKDTFTMDYQFPISAFQAFAICLSSFDTKIACE